MITYPIHMNKILLTLITVSLPWATTSIAYAKDMEQETQHLLDYIEYSGCIFIRNGSEYNADKARSHIQRKYDYVKDKVTTTEQVIQYAATESSWTGKPYMIHCPTQTPVPSGDWLSEELIRYRHSQH